MQLEYFSKVMSINHLSEFVVLFAFLFPFCHREEYSQVSISGNVTTRTKTPSAVPPALWTIHVAPRRAQRSRVKSHSPSCWGSNSWHKSTPVTCWVFTTHLPPLSPCLPLPQTHGVFACWSAGFISKLPRSQAFLAQGVLL